MGGAAIAEGKIPSIYEKHFGRARARAGVARSGEAMAVRSRAGQDSERQIALSVSFALERIRALSRGVGSRESSRQGWMGRSWSRRRVFLRTGPSASALQR